MTNFLAQKLQEAICFDDEGVVEKAEEIYRQLLSFDDSNIEVLNRLGVLLRSKGCIEEGRSYLQKSLSIQSRQVFIWYCLGNSFLQSNEYEKAVLAYREAIGVEKILFRGFWNNFGKALDGCNLEDEAILCYQREISIFPDNFDTLVTLGNRMRMRGSDTDAIRLYRKAIELNPDCAVAYLNLGNVLADHGVVEEAADAYTQHYRLKRIVGLISFPSPVFPLLPAALDPLPQVAVPEGVDFISSLVSDEIPLGMHLMYLHIPKAGGVRFSNPIFECIQLLLNGGWEEYSHLTAGAFARKLVSVMTSNRIDSAPRRDGIAASFSSYDFPVPDFSFLITHGVSSRELVLAMKEHLDLQPIRVATWREPEKRLRSALDYLYRTSSCDLDLVKARINQRDPLLDNAIYRGCFSDFSSQISSEGQCDAQVDYLIDIGDFSVMNQIIGAFLSKCRLPNIITNKKVNVTSADKKIDVSLADSLTAECLEAGFVSRDCSPGVEQLVSRKLPLEFVLKIDTSSSSLHPLTFVMNASTDVATHTSTCLLPTEYLMSDEGQDFLLKTFS